MEHLLNLELDAYDILGKEITELKKRLETEPVDRIELILGNFFLYKLNRMIPINGFDIHWIYYIKLRQCSYKELQITLG